MGQLGVFSPSCDRVGRVFPFIVSVPVVEGQHGALLERAGVLGPAWAQVIAQAQEDRLGIDAVDASLKSVLAETLAADPPQQDDDESTLPRGIDPSTMPWPDLRYSFDLYGAQSCANVRHIRRQLVSTHKEDLSAAAYMPRLKRGFRVCAWVNNPAPISTLY
jgi:hypothetical protein